MKRLFLLIAVVATFISSCQRDGVITVETPKRPAGQEDVIGLTAEPMDTVRIGIIGIGMRGRGAVYRMSRIEGTKIVAIADLLQENLAAGQERLAKAGRPAAAEYCGEDAWKELCQRDDIDLVYIVTDWKNHAHMGV